MIPTFPPSHVPQPTSYPTTQHRYGDTLEDEVQGMARVHGVAPRAVVMAALLHFFSHSPFYQHDLIADAIAWSGRDMVTEEIPEATLMTMLWQVWTENQQVKSDMKSVAKSQVTSLVAGLS